jgi:uroporphyrinogen-III decarboxylase
MVASPAVTGRCSVIKIMTSMEACASCQSVAFHLTMSRCAVEQEYLEIKQMMFKEPKMLHHMLNILADNIGDYANFQVICAAPV